MEFAWNCPFKGLWRHFSFLRLLSGPKRQVPKNDFSIFIIFWKGCDTQVCRVYFHFPGGWRRFAAGSICPCSSGFFVLCTVNTFSLSALLSIAWKTGSLPFIWKWQPKAARKRCAAVSRENWKLVKNYFKPGQWKDLFMKCASTQVDKALMSSQACFLWSWSRHLTALFVCRCRKLETRWWPSPTSYPPPATGLLLYRFFTTGTQ